MKTKNVLHSTIIRLLTIIFSVRAIFKLKTILSAARSRSALAMGLVALLALAFYSTSSASSVRMLLRGPSLASPSAASAKKATATPKKQTRKLSKAYKDDSSPVQGSGELNIKRRGHSATPLADGTLLIVGGENENGMVKDSEIYHAKSQSFSLSAKLDAARTEHTATRLGDGRVLIVGGRNNGGSLKSTEIFDPATNAISGGPSLNRARTGHTATVLADGRILIAGGDRRGSAEIFDPETQLFTAVVGKLNSSRGSHSSVLLKNGTVLIAGGIAEDGSPVQSGEIFDPETMMFSSAGTMRGIRKHPTLNVLPDGKVQIIGGDSDRSMEMFNAEGKYFTAYARLMPNVHSLTGISEAMRTETRAALIHRADESLLSLESGSFILRSDLIEFGGVASDLMDRSDHTITEIPGTGKVIITGGLRSTGETLSSMSSLESSPATVTTDLTDYHPGQTVIITGTNWQPGETVQLTLHRDNETPDTVLSAVADENGNIENSEYVVQESDLDLTFLLTAVGQSSGFTAQTTFTDSNITNDVSVSPTSVTVTAGNSAIYTVTVNFGGNTTPCTAPLSASDLPTGAVATFNPASVTGASNNTPKTSTLTITTTASGPSTTPPGTYVFTVTVSTSGIGCDGSSRTATGTLVVQSANVAPTITCPSNQTANTAPGQCTAVVNYPAPTATGTPTPTVNCTPASGSTFSKGTTTVNCTASNGVSPDATCSFTVTVNDTEAPTCNLPGNITQNNDAGECGAVVTYTATASDNCSGATITCSPTSGSLFPVGTTTVNCTASDASSDSPDTNCSFDVTVVDNEKPTITCPPDQMVTLVNNQATVADFTGLASAADNCAVASITQIPASGTIVGPGPHTITITAEDTSGNKKYCTFILNACYSFNGFFRPIDNLPTLNIVKAGSAIPIKFSLNGYQGLNIFAAGSPGFAPIACISTDPVDTVDETVNAGGSSLSYDATTDQYNYVWKTEKGWSGCRQLIVILKDGKIHRANFSFKK